jgi:hypothetical protein
LEEKAETKLITSLILAQYKRDATITATEATALAINDTSPNSQVNMQHHIKALVQETVKAHLTPSKKRKNSPGSKKPRPSLPKEKKNKGETTSTATTNATKKKVAFRYPLTDDEEEACDDDNNNEEAPSKKEQKKSHPSLKSKKKQNKTNKKGNQGEKKKGAKRGKQRKKND